MRSFLARYYLWVGKGSVWAVISGLFASVAILEIFTTHGWDNSIFIPILRAQGNNLSSPPLQLYAPILNDRITSSWAGLQTGMWFAIPLFFIVLILINRSPKRSGPLTAILCILSFGLAGLMGFVLTEPRLLDPIYFFDLEFLGAFAFVLGISSYLALRLDAVEGLPKVAMRYAHKRWNDMFQLVVQSTVILVTGLVVAAEIPGLTAFPTAIQGTEFPQAVAATQILKVGTLVVWVFVGVAGRVFSYVGELERGMG